MNKSNKWLKVIVTASLVMGSYACSESKTVEEYQAEAQKFIEQKDYKSALIALKNANAADTENAYLRFELGSVYLSQGDYANAEKEFLRAELLGYFPEKLLPKLAEVKFKLNKYDDVYDYADLARSLPDDSFIIVNTYAGLSSLYQGEYQQAKTYINTVTELQSDSIYGVLGKGYLAASADEVENALKAIDGILNNNPSFYEGHLLKSYLLQGAGKHLLAAESFENYQKLKPKDVSVLFFIAQNYINANEPKKAEPIVQSILKVAEHHPLANQMKAQVEFTKKDYKSAQLHAIKAYQQNDKLINSTMLAGISAYYLAEFENAYNHLIKIKDKLPKGHIVDKLLVELQLRLGYEQQAFNDITDLIDSGDANNSMLIAASHELLKSGNKTAAQELLNESLKLETTQPTQLMQQGLLKLQLSDLGEGIDLLEKSLELDPSSAKTEAVLALGYLTNNQLEQALKIAKSWQEQSDKKIQGLLFESSILKKQGKDDSAKQLLEETLTLDPKNTTALYQLALYELRDKNYELGYQYLTQTITESAKHTKAMQSLVLLAHQEKSFASKAEVFMQKQVDKLPNENILKLGLAYLFSNQEKHQEALTLLTTIKNSEQPIQGIELIIGDIYSKQGKLTEAIDNYKQFVAFAPDNLDGIGKLITAYERKNDIFSALSSVEAGLRFFPDNLGLKLLKVNYQSRLNKTVDEELLKELNNNKQAVDHFLLQSTLGNMAFAKGDMKQAKEHFEKSYKLAPTSLNVIQLSRAVGRLEGIDAAISVLKTHLSKHNNNSPQVQAVLANAYLQNKDYSMASLIYVDLLDANPANPLALNNMAFIHLKQNKINEALGYAKKAVKFAPNVAEVKDTYGQVLLLKGEYKLALDQFNKALDIKPNLVETKINKAKSLIKLNKNEEAKIELKTIEQASSEEQEEINNLLLSL